MRHIKNKKDIKELSKKWSTEMDLRKDWHMWIGIGGFFIALRWRLFEKYREVYFLEACVRGMATAVAWRYSKNKTKQEIYEQLKLWEWEK